LAIDFNTGRTDPLSCKSFSAACGEWFETRKRFGLESHKFVSEEERIQAHMHLFKEGGHPTTTRSEGLKSNTKLEKCLNASIYAYEY
jgi:hypothetical protein